MKKPLWEHAPRWANFLAMDGCNTWYWYEIEPSCNFYKHVNRWKNPNISRSASVVGNRDYNHNVPWKNTLEKRPQQR